MKNLLMKVIFKLLFTCCTIILVQSCHTDEELIDLNLELTTEMVNQIEMVFNGKINLENLPDYEGQLSLIIFKKIILETMI